MRTAAEHARTAISCTKSAGNLTWVVDGGWVALGGGLPGAPYRPHILAEGQSW
jgi:hypothetical protein